MKPLCALLCTAVLAVASPAQQTLRVGPGRPFQTIQAAVDAAAPWDRVLVDNGTYDESVMITKGLLLDCGGSVVRGPIFITGIPAGQQAHVEGAALRSAYTHPAFPLTVQITPLQISRSAGSVSVSTCSFLSIPAQTFKYYDYSNLTFVKIAEASAVLSQCSFGTTYRGAALEAWRSTVTLSSCGVIRSSHPYFTFLYGATGIAQPAIGAFESTLVIENTSVSGAPGLGLPAGQTNELGVAAVNARASRISMSGSGTVQGGDSVGNLRPGAPGVDHDGLLEYDGIALLGGAGSGGGPNGPPILGPAPGLFPIPDLTGPSAPTPLGGTMTFTGRAPAGSVLFWVASFQLDLRTSPVLVGALVHPFPMFVLPAPVPPSGQTSLGVPVPNDPALAGIVLYVQAGLATPGRIVLSGVAPAAVL